MKLNPPEVDQKNESINSFINYLDTFLVPQSIQQILPPSDVVGNIRFSHPTLYVFPGGQGDSALFGINGFNLLVDGGFSRRACFWDFSRHLDRLDAVLITRVSDDNTGGMSALLQRKTTSALYPQIGHVFANLPSKCLAQDMANDDDEGNDDNLIINVIEEGNSMLQSLQILNLQPQVCLRDKDAAYRPINLYHKVGHGKLDMYVVNPSRDAKDLKEFMERWNGENSKTLGTFKSGINVDGKELWLPLANLVSICALLVWLPDNPDDTVTRLLFPGSTPQNKVLKGLEKLRDLDFMQKPVCASRSVQKPTKQAPQKRESSKYGYRSTSRKPVMKDTVKEKSLDSVGGSKENIEKQDVTTKTEAPSRKTSAAQRKEEREKREEKERKRKEEKKKLLEEKEQKMLKAKEEKEKAEKLRRQQEKERRQQMKEVREKLEEKSRTTRRKVSEEKELKEQQNQAQASDLKGKEKSTGLKREKPIATSRTKRNEAIKPTKAKSEQQKKQPITADRNASLPSSKLRKDATNKTKKEEGIKSKLDTGIKSIKSKPKASEPMAAKRKSEKVDAVQSNVPPTTNNGVEIGNDEEAESIVEKHQIEAMETSPIDEQVVEDGQRVIEDDIEPELQRIKDDEDDVNNQGLRVADIPVADGSMQVKNEAAAIVVEPVLAATDIPKTATIHVKTPDEVPDLPEDEVATEVLDSNIPAEHEEQSPVKEFEMEEKIALDLQEKEIQSEKDDKEVEKDVKDEKDVQNECDVKNLLSPESEGAQEQKEVSEMVIAAPQVASIEEKQTEDAPQTNEKETASEGKESPINIQEENQSMLEKNVEKEEILKDDEVINKDGKPLADEEKETLSKEEDQTEKAVREVHSVETCDIKEDQNKDVADAKQDEKDASKEKFESEIANLQSVLANIEEICVKESNAVISQENTDEMMLKDIATGLNDTHKLKEDCNQFDYSKNPSDICRISDDIECLVKKVTKLAIELIGNDTSLACDLMEDVQKEADLILQCKTAKLTYSEQGNDEDGDNDKDSDNALELNIPMNIKELKVQESKEQASPKSESQSIVSADTSNRDMEEIVPDNNKDPIVAASDDAIVEEKQDLHDESDKKEIEEKNEEVGSPTTAEAKEHPEASDIEEHKDVCDANSGIQNQTEETKSGNDDPKSPPPSPNLTSDKVEEKNITEVETKVDSDEAVKDIKNDVHLETQSEKEGDSPVASIEPEVELSGDEPKSEHEEDIQSEDKEEAIKEKDETSSKSSDKAASEAVESISPSKSPSIPHSSNEKDESDEKKTAIDGKTENHNTTEEENKIHSEKEVEGEDHKEVSEVVEQEIECTKGNENEGEPSSAEIQANIPEVVSAPKVEEKDEAKDKEETEEEEKEDKVASSESSSKPQDLEDPEEPQDTKQKIKSPLPKEEQESKDDEVTSPRKEEKQSLEEETSLLSSKKEVDDELVEAKLDDTSETDVKFESHDVQADDKVSEKSMDAKIERADSDGISAELAFDEKIDGDVKLESKVDGVVPSEEEAAASEEKGATQSNVAEIEPMVADKTVKEINQTVSDIEKDLNAINEKMSAIEKDLGDVTEKAIDAQNVINDSDASPVKETSEDIEEKSSEKQIEETDKISGIFASDADNDDKAEDDSEKDEDMNKLSCANDDAKSVEDLDTVDNATEAIKQEKSERDQKLEDTNVSKSDETEKTSEVTSDGEKEIVHSSKDEIKEDIIEKTDKVYNENVNTDESDTNQPKTDDATIPQNEPIESQEIKKVTESAYEAVQGDKESKSDSPIEETATQSISDETKTDPDKELDIHENESGKGENKESSVVADSRKDGIPDDNKPDKEDDIKQEDVKPKVSDSTDNKEEHNDKTTQEEKVCKEEVIESCEEDISNENKVVKLENEMEDKKDESKSDSDEKVSEDKVCKEEEDETCEKDVCNENEENKATIEDKDKKDKSKSDPDEKVFDENVCKEKVIETCEKDICNENKEIAVRIEDEDKKGESKSDPDENISEEKVSKEELIETCEKEICNEDNEDEVRNENDDKIDESKSDPDEKASVENVRKGEVIETCEEDICDVNKENQAEKEDGDKKTESKSDSDEKVPEDEAGKEEVIETCEKDVCNDNQENKLKQENGEEKDQSKSESDEKVSDKISGIFASSADDKDAKSNESDEEIMPIESSDGKKEDNEDEDKKTESKSDSDEKVPEEQISEEKVIKTCEKDVCKDDQETKLEKENEEEKDQSKNDSDEKVSDRISEIVGYSPDDKDAKNEESNDETKAGESSDEKKGDNEDGDKKAESKSDSDEKDSEEEVCEVEVIENMTIEKAICNESKADQAPNENEDTKEESKPDADGNVSDKISGIFASNADDKETKSDDSDGGEDLIESKTTDSTKCTDDVEKDTEKESCEPQKNKDDPQQSDPVNEELQDANVDRKQSIISNVSEQEIPSTSPRGELDDVPIKEDAVVESEAKESGAIQIKDDCPKEQNDNENQKAPITASQSIEVPDESEREKAPSPLEKGMSQFFDKNPKESEEKLSKDDNNQIGEDKQATDDAKVSDSEIEKLEIAEEVVQENETAKSVEINDENDTNVRKQDTDGHTEKMSGVFASKTEDKDSDNAESDGKEKVEEQNSTNEATKDSEGVEAKSDITEQEKHSEKTEEKKDDLRSVETTAIESDEKVVIDEKEDKSDKSEVVDDQSKAASKEDVKETDDVSSGEQKELEPSTDNVQHDEPQIESGKQDDNDESDAIENKQETEEETEKISGIFASKTEDKDTDGTESDVEEKVEEESNTNEATKDSEEVDSKSDIEEQEKHDEKTDQKNGDLKSVETTALESDEKIVLDEKEDKLDESEVVDDQSKDASKKDVEETNNVPSSEQKEQEPSTDSVSHDETQIESGKQDGNDETCTNENKQEAEEQTEKISGIFASKAEDKDAYSAESDIEERVEEENSTNEATQDSEEVSAKSNITEQEKHDIKTSENNEDIKSVETTAIESDEKIVEDEKEDKLDESEVVDDQSKNATKEDINETDNVPSDEQKVLEPSTGNVSHDEPQTESGKQDDNDTATEEPEKNPTNDNDETVSEKECEKPKNEKEDTESAAPDVELIDNKEGESNVEDTEKESNLNKVGSSDDIEHKQPIEEPNKTIVVDAEKEKKDDSSDDIVKEDNQDAEKSEAETKETETTDTIKESNASTKEDGASNAAVPESCNEDACVETDAKALQSKNETKDDDSKCDTTENAHDKISGIFSSDSGDKDKDDDESDDGKEVKEEIVSDNNTKHSEKIEIVPEKTTTEEEQDRGAETNDASKSLASNDAKSDIKEVLEDKENTKPDSKKSIEPSNDSIDTANSTTENIATSNEGEPNAFKEDTAETESKTDIQDNDNEKDLKSDMKDTEMKDESCQEQQRKEKSEEANGSTGLKDDSSDKGEDSQSPFTDNKEETSPKDDGKIVIDDSNTNQEKDKISGIFASEADNKNEDSDESDKEDVVSDSNDLNNIEKSSNKEKKNKQVDVTFSDEKENATNDKDDTHVEEIIHKALAPFSLSSAVTSKDEESGQAENLGDQCPDEEKNKDNNATQNKKEEPECSDKSNEETKAMSKDIPEAVTESVNEMLETATAVIDVVKDKVKDELNIGDSTEQIDCQTKEESSELVKAEESANKDDSDILEDEAEEKAETEDKSNENSIQQIPKCSVEEVADDPVKDAKGLAGLKSVLLSPSKNENIIITSTIDDNVTLNGNVETEKDINIQEVVKELAAEPDSTFIRRLSSALSSVHGDDADNLQDKEGEKSECSIQNAENPTCDNETKTSEKVDGTVTSDAKQLEDKENTVIEETNGHETNIAVVPQPDESQISPDSSLNATLVSNAEANGNDKIICDDNNLNGAENIDNENDNRCGSSATSDKSDDVKLAPKDDASIEVQEVESVKTEKESDKSIETCTKQETEISVEKDDSIVNAPSDDKKEDAPEPDDKLPTVSDDKCSNQAAEETLAQEPGSLQTDGNESVVSITKVSSVCSISDAVDKNVNDDTIEESQKECDSKNSEEKDKDDKEIEENKVLTQQDDSSKTIQVKTDFCKIETNVISKEVVETCVSEETTIKTLKDTPSDGNIVTAVIKTTTNGEKIIRELSEGSDSHKIAEILDDAKETTQSVISKAEESVSDFISTSSNKTLTELPTATNIQTDSNEKSGKGDIVQESITIVKQSVSKPASEEEENDLEMVTTSVVSEKVVSRPSSAVSAVIEGSPKKDAKSTEVTMDPATVEEVTEKGIKIIDESLERVKVHLAKELELEPTDLASATSFEPPASTDSCVTACVKDKSESNSEETVEKDASKDGSSQKQDETNKEAEKEAKEKVEKWGEPMNLPSPIPPPNMNTRTMNHETKTKERSSRSDESQKPVYLDLAYVPYHGDSHYTDIEFFKRVRARYYVFSGVEPCKEVFNALLEAKKTWENKELGKQLTYLLIQD